MAIGTLPWRALFMHDAKSFFCGVVAANRSNIWHQSWVDGTTSAVPILRSMTMVTCRDQSEQLFSLLTVTY